MTMFDPPDMPSCPACGRREDVQRHAAKFWCAGECNTVFNGTTGEYEAPANYEHRQQWRSMHTRCQHCGHVAHLHLATGDRRCVATTDPRCECTDYQPAKEHADA